MVDKISIKDYPYNEEWHIKMQESIDNSREAATCLNDAIMEMNENVDFSEYVGIVLKFINSLETDAKMFPYYRDYLKSSYEYINATHLYCTVSYFEIKDDEENRKNHEDLFNQLNEHLNTFDKKISSFKNKIMYVLGLPDDQDISSEVLESINDNYEELSEYKNDIYKFCYSLMDYVENSKNKMKKRMEDSVEQESNNDGPHFVS